MDLSLVLICLADRPWEEALDAAVGYGLRHVEPCSGGYFPKVHYDPARLVADDEALDAFGGALESRGLAISALCCCGNPVHPNPERARAAHDDYVATCRLAGRLGVDRVGVLSGCPGGGPLDTTVNWIVQSVFDDPVPDIKEAYRWQWEECLIPYWRDAARVAEENGVTICLEPIASNTVYNPETFERLRDAVGPTIGMLFDPSHFFWQRIDIPKLILRLGEAITYVHAKDVSFDDDAVGREGLVSAVEYESWDARPWIPRAVGYGHPESFWREFVIALRRAGYGGPISLEVEEPYLTTHDAIRSSLTLLRSVLPSEGPPSGNWYDVYAAAPPDGTP